MEINIRIVTLVTLLFGIQLLDHVPFCLGRNLDIRLANSITNQLLQPGAYNKDEIPLNISNDTSTADYPEPLQVCVQFFLRNINFLDDVNMELSIQFALRMEWLDYRLAYTHLLPVDLKDRGRDLNLDSSYITLQDLQDIWYPDLVFSSEKRGSTHDIVKPNVMVRIRANGTVQLSMRLSLVFYCPMDLHWYPFDRHDCFIPMYSYSLPSSEVNVTWNQKKAIEFPKSNQAALSLDWAIQLPRFKLVNYSAASCSYETGIGIWACIIVNLTFTRQLSCYFITIFMPCIMIVAISWLSMWFDVTAIDARVALGVTTVLTMATLIQGINQSMPPVSYTRAADIFVGFCLGFVVLSLLEFTLVDLMLRTTTRAVLGVRCGSIVMVKPKPLGFDNEKGQMDGLDSTCSHGRVRASRMDNLARILFPLCFLGFLAIFFSVCLLRE